MNQRECFLGTTNKAGRDNLTNIEITAISFISTNHLVTRQELIAHLNSIYNDSLNDDNCQNVILSLAEKGFLRYQT